MSIEEEFRLLYQRHYDAVLRYAARRVELESAQDVAAETFLVAWRHFHQRPVEAEHALPWLYGVAAKVLAGSYRSGRRRDRLRLRVAAQPEVGTTPDIAVGVSARVSLLAALSQQSPADQEVLRLAGWEELDLAGIALAMGCSKGTAAGRLHRARKRLLATLSTKDVDVHRNLEIVSPQETQ